MITNVSARTESPNTPESDMQARIWHIVEYTDEDGVRQETKAYATDPMEAIQMIQERYAQV
jgi:hypothetical protein